MHNVIRPPRSTQGLKPVVIPPLPAPVCEMSPEELRQTNLWRAQQRDAEAGRQHFVQTVRPKRGKRS